MTAVKHKNFYENLTEAQMRLLNTVVVYDHDDSRGVEPYYVYAICSHKSDGVFRIYLESLHRTKEIKPGQWPQIDGFPRDHPQVGEIIDKWMEVPSNKDYFLRKKMDSKYFMNFRPFPLGMCNLGGKDGRCFYIERQPQRHREQGLTESMVVYRHVTLAATPPVTRRTDLQGHISFKTPAFRACVRGEYPPIEDVLRELKDPRNGNEAVGFHRLFAIVKGPMDLLFLGYKDKIIGLLPNADLSEVRLGKEFGYTREAVEELKLFDRIVQRG